MPSQYPKDTPFSKGKKRIVLHCEISLEPNRAEERLEVVLLCVSERSSPSPS